MSPGEKGTCLASGMSSLWIAIGYTKTDDQEKVSSMDYSTENLCYLLWVRKVPCQAWCAQISEWLACDRSRAWGLLTGAALTETDYCHLHSKFEIGRERFRYSRLLSEAGLQLLPLNLHYFMDALEHGQKLQLAAHLNVHRSTISKWLAGMQHPSRKYINMIRAFLKVPPTVDLESDAAFLSPEPVTEFQQRQWLADISKLDSSTMQLLFPDICALVAQRLPAHREVTSLPATDELVA